MNSGRVKLLQGCCLTHLPTLPDASVDAVVTDPPYPEISRDYGRMTEPEWHAMMDVVVPECRRILKPTGSAVFILQPNSERVGRMRPWLWEFMAKWTKEWGMVQDAWWWKLATPPTVHCHRERGLMRPSMKACVWLGLEDCFRDQDQVVLPLSEASETDKRIDRHELDVHPSGLSMRKGRALQTCRDRGGVTPFNVVVCANSDSTDGAAGNNGHGAGSPAALCDWWCRYICPPGGTVLDPFIGSGTCGISAIRYGMNIVGIERDVGYFETATRRIGEALAVDPFALFPPKPLVALKEPEPVLF